MLRYVIAGKIKQAVTTARVFSEVNDFENWTTWANSSAYFTAAMLANVSPYRLNTAVVFLFTKYE